MGTGLAILDMSRSVIYPKNGANAIEGVHPSVETPVVPPGEAVDVTFAIPASKSLDGQKMTLFELAGGGANQLFTVEVAYGDALGNAGITAKFRAHRYEGQNDEWSMYEVEYRFADGKVVTTRKYG
ncbi:MAG: hypothetical protein ACRENX_10330 [Candidatus Dormibacteria bacterium]